MGRWRDGKDDGGVWVGEVGMVDRGLVPRLNAHRCFEGNEKDLYDVETCEFSLARLSAQANCHCREHQGTHNNSTDSLHDPARVPALCLIIHDSAIKRPVVE